MRKMSDIFMYSLFDKKIITNGKWLLIEKIFSLASLFIISIIVANHLGPQKYGILSYGRALYMLLEILVYLGLTGLVIKDLVETPIKKNAILGTGLFLKMIGGGMAMVLMIIYAYIIHGDVDEFYLTIIILSVGLIFKPLEVFQYWFESKVNAKAYTFVYLTNSVLLLSISIIMIYLDLSLIYFVSVWTFDSIFKGIGLLMSYKYDKNNFSELKVEISYAKSLLKKSSYLIFSGFLSIIYLKIDQIMIQFLMNSSEVGYYAIAAMISESWYYISIIIVSSVYPLLTELRTKDKREYNKKLQNLFDILFVLSFFVGIFFMLYADFIIITLLGENYLISSNILKIHIWTGIFIFMRNLLSRWLILEDLLKFSLISHGVAAITNILLNLFLIQMYGGIGASIASLISYGLSSYFVLLLSPKTRKIWVMMSRSYLIPIRGIIKSFRHVSNKFN